MLRLQAYNNKAFPVQISDWASMRKYYLMVDKTYLLISIIQGKHQLITCPRKCGKSTNLSMLETFFNYPLTKEGELDKVAISVNKLLFIGTKSQQEQSQMDLTPYEKQQIWKERQRLKHLQPLNIYNQWERCQYQFANYIVLKMTFQKKISSQGKSILRNLKIDILKIILRWYQRHDYLQQRQFLDAYKNLIKLIKDCQKDETDKNPQYKFDYYLITLFHSLKTTYKKKIILLIDDYDAPYFNASVLVQNFSQSEKTVTNISKFITWLLTRLTIGYKQLIAKIICAGVNFIIFMDQSSVQMEFSTLDRPRDMDQFYGFSEKQIKQQLVQKKFKNKSSLEKNQIQELMNVLKQEYGGIKIERRHHKSLSPSQYSKINANEQQNYFLYSQSCQKYRKNGKDLDIYNPYSINIYLTECENMQCILRHQKIEQIHSFQFDKSSLFFIKYYMDRLDPKNRIIIYNLLTNILKNQQTKVYKKEEENKDLQHLQYMINKFFFKTSGFIKKLIVDKHISDLSVQEVIFLLIQNGFLTYEKEKIKIPNNQLRGFFKNIIKQHLFKIVQTVSIPKEKERNDMSNIVIQQWNSWKDIVKNNLEFFLRIFSCFSDSLFGTLVEIEMGMHSHEKRYTIMNVKGRIQPDLVLVPTDVGKKVIIQEHKVLYGNRTAERMEKKLQEALFQILRRNYFKIVTDSEEYKEGAYQGFIIRGVVANYHQQALTLQSAQIHLTRSQAALVSEFFVLSVEDIDDKKPTLKGLIYPRSLERPQEQRVAEFLEDFTWGCNAYTLAWNSMLIDKAKELWKEKERKRLLGTTVSVSAYKSFAYLLKILKIKFFGFELLMETFNDGIICANLQKQITDYFRRVENEDNLATNTQWALSFFYNAYDNVEEFHIMVEKLQNNENKRKQNKNTSQQQNSFKTDINTSTIGDDPFD